jgi:hypothetical protein
MSDSNDAPTSDAASRHDDLISAIRVALAPDAPAEIRAGGVTACRAILRGLEPLAMRNGAPASSPTSALAGTPLGTALGALGAIPREQILGLLVSGVRAMLGDGAPAYRTAPLPRAPASTERSE